jgi:hypothetical protein
MTRRHEPQEYEVCKGNSSLMGRSYQRPHAPSHSADSCSTIIPGKWSFKGRGESFPVYALAHQLLYLGL